MNRPHVDPGTYRLWCAACAYSSLEISRGLTNDLRDRYFARVDRRWAINPALRRRDGPHPHAAGFLNTRRAPGVAAALPSR